MKQILLLGIGLLAFIDMHAQHDRTVFLNGTDLHYVSYGKGDPILIINGGPGMSCEGFRDLALKLSESNRAIIYDQRGTGLSRLSRIDSSHITMDLMVADVEALRRHLGIKSWIVLGHSFGGMLACYYASKEPKVVRAMILSSSGGIDLELLEHIDITSRLTELQRDSLAYWSERIRNGDTTFAAALGRGRNLAPAYVYDKKHVPAIAERLTQGNMRVNGLVFADMRRIGFDCSFGLRSFNKPVLILQGEQDIVDLSIAQKAHNCFPDSRLVILSNCVHYGWLDQPEKYFAEIRSFLSKLDTISR